MPCNDKPFAASSPSRPPPITTAFLHVLAATSIFSTSSMLRYASTPGRSMPGIGSMIGLEPVAISKRS
jgi:hypothetical protein